MIACQSPWQSVSAPPDDTQAAQIQQAVIQTAIAQTLTSSEDTGREDAQPATPEPETATPEPEPTPTIEHLVRPGEPGQPNTWVTDNSTKALAASRETSADLFNTNFLERPFTSEVMDYLGYLDLTRVNLSFSAPWVYVSFVLEESPPAESTAIYALELDLDSDGRGDWLMLGRVPDGTEWTTAGAQAFQDTNNDVGGFSPMNAENPDSRWDGYETLVFEDGVGADPDAVWVRRDPGNQNQVQLAFKYSLIGNDSSFAFGGWADDGLKDPSAFDYNDSMTYDQAGAPFSGSSRYPIKELAQVDNTCRWTYGYTPTTSFPGLCPLPPTPTPTPVPGTISGGVFSDFNSNGIRNSSEPGISGITVRLGSGACGSTGLASTTTSSSGSFSFSNVAPGTYCVSITFSSSCGNWEATTPTQQTITLGPGENKLIAWFGLRVVLC